MRHLALNCPRCHHELTVWITDLGQTFKCKNCRTPFHVDPNGKCVKGQRVESDEVYNPYQLTPKSNHFDPLEWLWDLPRAVHWLLLAAVIALGAQVVVAFTRPQSANLPNSLVARTEYVATAFLANDNDRLSVVADPATKVSTSRWLELKRPANWSIWQQATQARTKASVLFQNTASKTACTVATIAFPPFADGPDATSSTNGRRANAAPVGPRVELVMFWTMSSDGTWLFDGARTVKESARR